MPTNDGPDTSSSTPANTASPSDSQVAGKKRKAPSSTRGVASLTPEQLAKKRANDREAQRAIRERTKVQIETLEGRIRELQSQQPYQELQAVIREKQAIQDENDEIKRRLASVLSIIQPIIGAQGLTEPAANPRPEHPPAQRPVTSNDGIPTQRPDFPPTAAVPVEQQVAADLSYIKRQWATPEASHDQSYTALDYQKNNLQHGLDLESGERLGLNFLLDAKQQVTRIPGKDQNGGSQPSTPATLQYTRSPSQTHSNFSNEVAPWAVPCRNIAPTCPLDTILLDFLHSRQREASQGVSSNRLLGPAYPSVSSLLNPEKSIYSHPLSKVFTDILSKFPDISALPEQVAVLYTMFLVMRWQIHPTQENYDRLPEWLCPRASQLFTPHPAWMDYVPWPKMRDKLALEHASYPFENYFIPYTTTLSLNWPYEATDTLLCAPAAGDNANIRDGELMINPVFETHLRDLRNWSLGPEFAEAHPRLAEGIRISKREKR